MNHLEYDENNGKDISREEKSYTILIIYDIINDKKRNRMAKFLESYGIRVQKSAFEVNLTKKRCDIMLERATKMIDLETDSLRVYLLPNKAHIRSWGIGVKIFLQDTIII